MSKRKIFLLGIGFLILTVLGVFGFFYLREDKGLVNPLSGKGETKRSEEGKTGNLLLYEDEAGFSFQYPQDLGIVEKDVKDPNVYSSLELSSKKYPGEKLIVRIADTSLPSVEKWLEKNPREGNLVTSAEISLGGMKGKSFQYAQPARNLILVIDSGILYFFEAPSDGSFWDEAFGAVSSSFQLTEEKTIVEEEEEIIE